MKLKTFEDFMIPFHQEPILNPEKIKELFEKTITDNFVGYSRIDGAPIFECNIEYHRNYHTWKECFSIIHMKEDETTNNHNACIKVTDCKEQKIIKILREKKLIRILFEG